MLKEKLDLAALHHGQLQQRPYNRMEIPCISLVWGSCGVVLEF